MTPLPLSRVAAAVCLIGLMVFRPISAGSQPTPRDETWETRVWMGDVAFLGANSILAGLTSGLFQAARGESFERGFTQGALGGAITYGGRRVATREFWGAGLVGRQVSAVGSSVVRNASKAQPIFSRVSVPIGPLSIVVRPERRMDLRAKVDLWGSVWLVSALLDDRLELDGSASLSAGAPVFRTPRHRISHSGDDAYGIMVGGNIILGYNAGQPIDHDVFAHERAHVLQFDFLQQIWGDPLENWMGSLLPGGDTVLAVVRPGFMISGLVASAQELLNLEWEEEPWEMEAQYLSRR